MDVVSKIPGVGQLVGAIAGAAQQMNPLAQLAKAMGGADGAGGDDAGGAGGGAAGAANGNPLLAQMEDPHHRRRHHHANAVDGPQAAMNPLQTDDTSGAD